MLFDTYNPWAALIQLNSTHPLTGRRVAYLGEIAKAKGQSFGDYDVEAAARRVHLDRGKLWGQFLGELLFLLAPILFGLAVAIMGAWQFVPAAIAAGVVATLPLHYPFGAPSGTTVMALMSDAAASPVRGQPVRLEGKAIGRVQAGFIAGEDIIFQDKTGLMAVDFRSMLGVIGNLFAGWKFVVSGGTRPWLQEELVAKGLARVYSFPDNRACVAELLARETEARAKRLGVWGSPAYRIQEALDVERLGRLTHSYQLVEGTVASVGEGGGRIYLNFAKDWRNDFTISIERKDAAAFTTAGIDLKGLTGKRVRVRGWVEWRNGPMIEATHPEQIEILPDARAFSDQNASYPAVAK